MVLSGIFLFVMFVTLFTDFVPFFTKIVKGKMRAQAIFI